MFRGHIRRSGSKRSIWHTRERKRRPRAALPPEPVAPPQPVRFRYVPTEAKWNSDQPATMLRCLANLALQTGESFHLSRPALRRKYRLFNCACCRLSWGALPVRAKQVVETVERCADGRGTAKLLRDARRTADAVERAVQPVPNANGFDPADWEVARAVQLAGAAAATHVRLRLGSAWPVCAAAQAALLRDLFGNPFHPVETEPAWLTQPVRALAHLVRTERAFELMPVLGDALQDAGCERAEVLEHCYGPGPHTVGCWLVDSLSGW